MTDKEKDQPVAEVDDKGDLFPEQQIETRMTTALRTGETLAALKDNIEILNSYPGSRVARRLKDKPLDIYGSLSDRADLSDGRNSDESFGDQQDADASRLADWAGSLHRRAGFKGALTLADKALGSLSMSTQATNLLWIAGRSAQFLGQYDLAMKYFDELGAQTSRLG